MSTACDNFKPHIWKPKQCAACFRPKSEHSGCDNSTGSSSTNELKSTARMKQSPYYKRFSFGDDDNEDKKVALINSEPARTDQQSAAPTSSEAVPNTAALRKPDGKDKPDETNEQSSSLQATVVGSDESARESVSNKQDLVNDNIDNNCKATSEVTRDSDMSEIVPARPPPPRARSQSMAVPRIKPRKHVPESSDIQSSDIQSSTTKTLPRDLQPVPAPRRNRSNSPRPSSIQGEDPSVSRAKSLDNLDVPPVSSPVVSDRKVKFRSETITIPDPSTSPTTISKIEPYAVSEVSDILQNAATKDDDEIPMESKNMSEEAKEDNDDNEYIEADQLNANVVSVSELKNKHKNSKTNITKYSTLSALQPTKKLTGNGDVKQKSVSAGSIATNKTAPRRIAPPPPQGAPRNRSATTASIDKTRARSYTSPRRPPPPIYYSNSNVVVKPSKVNETPVNKVPPPKPLRTPSTFDYENVNGTTTNTTVEYSVMENDVTSKEMSTYANDPISPRPKKPVRMPKEASPAADGDTTQSSSQPTTVKGRYIDLDIDQLEAGKQAVAMGQNPIMKYQNFDDFSPRSLTPELKSPNHFDALSASLPSEGAVQVQDAILNSLNVASVELVKFYFGEFSYMGKVTCSKWSEFDAVGQASAGTTGCVKHNGKLLSLQDFSKERVDGEKAILLPPHPNISRAIAFFYDNPPSKLVHKFKVKKGRVIGVTDYVPVATVSEFVKKNYMSMKQLEYDRHVLLILVQLFSALKHLQQNGAVHRDLSAETCRYDPQSGILKLTDFTYALYRPPPVTASTFIYGYGELKWLGGTGSKLPPEIINTPDDCQALDYSLSDIFAAGCMIYELFAMQPPFDKDESLICKRYSRDDLILIPKRSQYSNLINQLIYLLLQVDTSKRIKPDAALLLVQTILWAPVSWMHGTVSETAIQSYLAVEKARLVTSVALNSLKGDGRPSVELMLKNMFIQECKPSNLINVLSMLHTE